MQILNLDWLTIEKKNTYLILNNLVGTQQILFLHLFHLI